MGELTNKIAVIYGAGGAIGGAVARAFAREGASLFLTGHRLAPVQAVAKDIVSTGGAAEAAEVDALDDHATDRHLQSVAARAGRIDISFNAMGNSPTKYLGTSLVDIDLKQFSMPITSYTTSYLLTARLAARRMLPNKSGVAESRRLFDLADADFSARLSSVQQALYLLFNEGYHGASSEAVVRTELCQEAMRLVKLLLEQSILATPKTYALAALMYLNAARLPTRLDGAGNLVSFFEQDRSLWDRRLLAEGQAFLDLSASGTELTEYHIEAAIASVHTSAVRGEDTDWKQIVSLYDTLMAIHPSPVVALNRAIAITQLDGPERGLKEISAIQDLHRLSSYPFYPATLGELELRRGNCSVAKAQFSTALSLARNPMERNFLQRRIEACKEVP